MTIEGPELARRLKAARKAAGLTQDAVAAALEIPRPAVGLIEKSKRTVSGIELNRLAVLYRMDLGRLLGETARGAVARFRKDDFADMPEVAAALEDCLRVGRDLARLERLTGAEIRSLGVIAYDLPQAQTPRQAIVQGMQTAEAERRRLGLGDEPVADLVGLIDANGVRTATLDMPVSVSGIMLIDAEAGTLIAVNRSQHILRRRFSLAHEYGHSLLDRTEGPLVSRSDDRNDLREVRANAFASALLMPESGLRRRLAELGKATTLFATDLPSSKPARTRTVEAPQLQLHDVAILAHAFAVSRLAMLNRLRTMGAVAPNHFTALRKMDASSGAAVARLLDLEEPDHVSERARFDRRYTRLALEAHLAGKIDATEFVRHLIENVGCPLEEAEAIAASVAGSRRSSPAAG